MESDFPGAIKQTMKSHLRANSTFVLSVQESITSSVEMQWETRASQHIRRLEKGGLHQGML